MGSSPLADNDLRGKAKLGKRKKSVPLPEIADMVRNRYSGLFGEIFERRVKRELHDSISEEAPAEHILEYLTKRNVLYRKWKLDQCPGCGREYWASDLDIRVPLRCPGCRTYIPYKDTVRLGYELNPLVELALEEGARPVLLTARFLRNLTWHGFLMCPGVKLKKDDRETDIDLCAIADEILIAGECKNLAEFKKNGKVLWGEILSQLTLPVEVAKACGFSVFFVASLTDRYPRSFLEGISRLTGDSLKLLFLNREDLESGIRMYRDTEGHERTLTLHHVLEPPKPFRLPKDKRRIRTISF